ncbi:MAG: hypothetical protein H7A51_03630 [Akkermansiaceae bacterium]|nr:hypothetical protein [Akkermansiaceae bacterium]
MPLTTGAKSSAPLPPTDAKPLEYEARITLFDKVCVYRLDANSIRAVSELGEFVYPLADIVSVRCRFFPTRVQRNRYETILTMRTGGTLKICNQFFKGVADFEDRSPAYANFVKGLHNHLATQNPRCAFHAGTTALGFWLNALFLGAVLLILIVLGIIMITAIPAVAIIKFLIILFYTPTCWCWFKRNKPRRYDPKNIPPDVLP